ncbi:hypothetical protein BGZ63DRAFT_189228 [Mariannaea sp. PMI_226]|nr:hypothetical protein BGZ63DRAFT_189228 [Mariannaea sp. PMI_226]
MGLCPWGGGGRECCDGDGAWTNKKSAETERLVTGEKGGGVERCADSLLTMVLWFLSLLFTPVRPWAHRGIGECKKESLRKAIEMKQPVSMPYCSLRRHHDLIVNERPAMSTFHWPSGPEVDYYVSQVPNLPTLYENLLPNLHSNSFLFLSFFLFSIPPCDVGFLVKYREVA